MNGHSFETDTTTTFGNVGSELERRVARVYRVPTVSIQRA